MPDGTTAYNFCEQNISADSSKNATHELLVVNDTLFQKKFKKQLL